MQNADNLRFLVGKNKRPKPKKKLITHVPETKNPLWQNMMQKMIHAPLLPTPGGLTRGNTVFPSGLMGHGSHQQDDLVELVDDNSPNNPIMGTISRLPPIVTNKPGGFQKPWFTPKQKNTTEAISVDPIEQKSGENANQSIDVKKDTSKNPPNVTEGSASKIQIFADKTMQKTNTSTETDDKNSSNTENTTNINVDQPNPQTIQADSKNTNTSRFRDLLSVIYSYPKGIPKSFLKQQQQQQRNQYTAPQTATSKNQTKDDMPNWVLKEQNIFPMPEENTHDEPIFGTNIAPNLTHNMPTNVVTEQTLEPSKAYSPSDVYAESSFTTTENNEEFHEGSESPEVYEPGSKRLSAFKRLGPLAQPKKPKLTINLQCNKDQSVREVVDETEKKEEQDKHTPVHLRQDILSSTDEIVQKYLPQWPWQKAVYWKPSVTARSSKSVMILEQEQMEEAYLKTFLFIQVSVKGYPPSWKKEDVLDALLESLKGRQFIPCFIEFTLKECKFLVIRSRAALVFIHKCGFCIRKDSVELIITITKSDLTLNHIEFIPRLVLRKRLTLGYDSERKLSLKEFTLKSDISHFIYFPLNRVCNQIELIKLEGAVEWEFLTELDLSHNKMTSIAGFELQTTTPKLKHLDLSYNHLERLNLLLSCRELSLHSIKLEGNPLCHDYTDPHLYVRVIKMIFPSIKEIDGVPIRLKGDMPKFIKNYCPEDAKQLVEKFLEIFFPLLDAPFDQRAMIESMYGQYSSLTVTYMYRLRYSPIYKKFRSLFYRARVLDEGEAEYVEGATAIAKVINKWPNMEHDPSTFTVDVLAHDKTTTILRIGGILKLTAETLAEDEHLLAFTRTMVLYSSDDIEYKITNEMLYWDHPAPEYANTAFRVTKIQTRTLSLKLEFPPDEELKEKLLEMFMEMTHMDIKSSVRCLEIKNWNLKTAIEHFSNLLKLNDLESLTK